MEIISLYSLHWNLDKMIDSFNEKPTSILICRSFIKYDRELFKEQVYKGIEVNYANKTFMKERIFMYLEKKYEKNNSNNYLDNNEFIKCI